MSFRQNGGPIPTVVRMIIPQIAESNQVRAKIALAMVTNCYKAAAGNAPKWARECPPMAIWFQIRNIHAVWCSLNPPRAIL